MQPFKILMQTFQKLCFWKISLHWYEFNCISIQKQSRWVDLFKYKKTDILVKHTEAKSQEMFELKMFKTEGSFMFELPQNLNSDRK